MEILYDVSDADGDTLSIGMQVSGDAGQTYSIDNVVKVSHIFREEAVGWLGE